jgi:hypothetical protein
MESTVAIRFFSVPGHQVITHPDAIGAEEVVEPDMPALLDVIEKALMGTEFRDMRSRDRLRSLLSPDHPTQLPPPDPKSGPSAVFAQPPQDLPALLRLADQLDSLARQDEGEKALVWKCETCGTRYAVPVALVRPVSIRCERCENPIELTPERSLGEEHLVDPFRGAINKARKQLAHFFREAMARGWPVLVCNTRN